MDGWIMEQTDDGRESKLDIRVPVFVLLRSQSNAVPQALVWLGPRVVQVWDGTQTVRRVRS